MIKYLYLKKRLRLRAHRSLCELCTFVINYKILDNFIDEDCPHRPNGVTTLEMIGKIQHIVINNRRAKVSEIAEIVGISNE